MINRLIHDKIKWLYVLFLFIYLVLGLHCSLIVIEPDEKSISSMSSDCSSIGSGNNHDAEGGQSKLETDLRQNVVPLSRSSNSVSTSFISKEISTLNPPIGEIGKLKLIL